MKATAPAHRSSIARPTQFVAAVLLVGAATGLCRLGQSWLALPDLVMVYVLEIMIAAAFLDLGPSLLAAVLSVGAYDFFFIPPYFTFAVSEARHLLTFGTMLIVGALINGLTRRVRRQAEATQAASERARTEEMRSSLLSAVSHDLRTPLAAITGAASTLRADEDEGTRLPRRERLELLDTVCEEAERLERLLGNLLDMTRLESGAMQLRREWVPLDEIVGAVLARLESRLGERPVHVALPEDLAMLWVDPVLVELLLINLLENALKYTPTGSPIEVRGTRGDDERSTLIEVADRGEGISPAVLPHLFEKFRRGSHVGIAGVGLGLAICKAIVEAHGGSIQAEARPGGGALFRVTLPQPEGAPGLAPATMTDTGDAIAAAPAGGRP